MMEKYVHSIVVSRRVPWLVFEQFESCTRPIKNTLIICGDLLVSLVVHTTQEQAEEFFSVSLAVKECDRRDPERF